MSTDLGYIAAAECCSPNSPEFEALVDKCRAIQARRVVRETLHQLSDKLNCGQIDDKSYLSIEQTLKAITFES